MRTKLTLILILFPLYLLSQEEDHFESIISSGMKCRYYIPLADIGSNWTKTVYDDSFWSDGIVGVGYGDNDDNTVIEGGISSLYLRYTFQVTDLSTIQSLILDADYDDGFIAYLNGKEIARANINNPVSWNMELSVDHEAQLYSDRLPERFEINSILKQECLFEGLNVLAIEVHNRYNTSSDLSSNFFLHAGITNSTPQYSKVPAWFWEPINSVTFTTPIMVINTSGRLIKNDPRIVVRMGLIDNGPGNVNRLEDPCNEYDGDISIETRGESSNGLEKKSYTIELQNPDGTNNNVSLLGLPSENDFVLYAPYSDKTLMRNALVYNLYNNMDNWAPGTRYIELFLNGEYRGVYILTEKVKRDENRVDIDKISSDEITAPGITGGYILRRDKTTGMAPEEYWASPVSQIYYEPLIYQYFDPDYSNLNPLQRQYIRDYMKQFDELMSGPNFADPLAGYRSYINVKSFIDMLILNEFSKGVDNYMFSTYFFKQNDEDGGKLFAGPPWDCDLSLGNVNYGYDNNIPYTHSWVYNNWSRVYWWKRLMEDPRFENEVFCRWDDLRSNVLSNERIENFIDSSVFFLGDAVGRNFNKFRILGKYIWPNQSWPVSYEEEIDNLKSWTFDRLNWMDNEWAGYCELSTGEEVQLTHMQANGKEFSANVRPNPSDLSNTYIDIVSGKRYHTLTFEILDLRGVLIRRISTVRLEYEKKGYRLPDLSYLSCGIYFIRILNENNQIYLLKMIKSN